MKKTSLSLSILSTILLAFITMNAYATKHVITVANNTFTPQTIPNVIVGDTIRWVWAAGFHSTTSNPGVLPSGATAWDKDITSSSTFFEYKVTKAGPYAYYCKYHATPIDQTGMVGGFNASAPTGIQQSALFNANLSIFPKPAKETLNVNFSSTTVGKSLVKLYDIQGREVLAEEADVTIGTNALQLSVGNLNNGIYFVEVYANKRKLGTQKIIKE